MKKNGFTLVELLGVLVLLIVIFLLIYPSVYKVINSGEDTAYDKQINTILSAAYDWSLKNTSKLPEGSEKTYVTLAQLKSEGLIDNIIDTKTREPFSDDLVISISYVGKNYNNGTYGAKVYGDYLYRIENLPTYDSIANKTPVIKLNGLVKNSSGNYVTNVDLNSEFDDSDYTATSYDGVDLTDRVVVNITHNDDYADFVDTSKIGIYYINYTVVDDNGNSDTVVRNVIVSDISAPTLNFPDENTISVGSNDFNLMSGVSCEDNSGNCDITTSGNFNINVKDKYVIEYSAKDPSGNTTTKRRVITVQ